MQDLRELGRLDHSNKGFLGHVPNTVNVCQCMLMSEVLLWSSLDPVKAVHADPDSEATEEEPQEDEEVAETSPAPVRKGSRKSQVLPGSRCC